ncbi:hypothetical protein SUNI508_00725 [Seiridium unicorne]|uniref:Uncharacterized protein n=1 Tax=Seiridium unicorne TaxID=138068 RepID=A0ABR2V129_9PEZI
MAKETPKEKSSNASEEKALPIPRPGTSGTENLLITNRRQASEQFIKAQRAEKAYRAKKQATLARHNYNETKAHFKESASHFKLGVKGLISVVRAIPHLIGEKREERRKQAEAKRRQRDLEKKKKLEDALARQSPDTADDKEEEAES